MSAENEKRQQAYIPEWQRDMANCVGDDLLRDIVADSKRGLQPSSPLKQSGPTVEVKRGSGWQDAAPLQQPPGIKIIDAMMDQQDKLDKAERIRKALELAAISKRSEKMK